MLIERMNKKIFSEGGSDKSVSHMGDECPLCRKKLCHMRTKGHETAM